MRLDISVGLLDSQVVSFFVSFLMTPISSQSDIWAESYDQNTGGYLDGLTKRPDGQLQPPFQNSTILSLSGPHPDGLAERLDDLRCISFPRS
jgi:hypothetical protein